MSIYSDARSAIRAGTVSLLTNLNYGTTPVIYSHQNAPEPTSTYVVIQIISLDQRGRVSSAYRTTEGTELVKHLEFVANYEVRVQLSFIGSVSADIAYDFDNSILNNVVAREGWQKVNLVPIRKSIVRRIPQLRDTQWVEVQNIDVTFAYAVKTSQPIDWVETVTIDNQESGEIQVIPPVV